MDATRNLSHNFRFSLFSASFLRRYSSNLFFSFNMALHFLSGRHQRIETFREEARLFLFSLEEMFVV